VIKNVSFIGKCFLKYSHKILCVSKT
jgi:hypothetical protein